ncbi:MAG TPA: VOC family protein [Gemmatimonadaceae bacterium]|nr:VOC family protein [Gemmatimonadaceae bacterium]
MTATMNKLSPVLLVEQIEPVLPFWVDRLGFKKTVEVPEGDKLGFVILEKDNVEIMYQSRASIEGDIPALGRNATGGSILFIEVGDLNEVERAVRGAEITVPRRRAPYGMDEIGVREPGGNVVLFAQPVAQGR